jgi:hypothetical protein
MLATLAGLKTYFSSHGFDCEILEKSAEFETEQLIVALGPDEKGRDLVLSVRSSALPIDQKQFSSSKEAVEGSTKSYNFLQFACCLPFKVQESALWEMARMILLLNKGLELPGFELSEVDGIVYYRYVLPVVDNHVEETLLICLFGTIDFLVKGFTDKLEQIATGAKTAQQLVEESQKDLQAN